MTLLLRDMSPRLDTRPTRVEHMYWLTSWTVFVTEHMVERAVCLAVLGRTREAIENLERAVAYRMPCCGEAGLAALTHTDIWMDLLLRVPDGHAERDRIKEWVTHCDRIRLGFGATPDPRQARLFASWKTWTGVDVPDPYPTPHVPLIWRRKPDVTERRFGRDFTGSEYRELFECLPHLCDASFATADYLALVAGHSLRWYDTKRPVVDAPPRAGFIELRYAHDGVHLCRANHGLGMLCMRRRRWTCAMGHFRTALAHALRFQPYAHSTGEMFAALVVCHVWRREPLSALAVLRAATDWRRTTQEQSTDRARLYPVRNLDLLHRAIRLLVSRGPRRRLSRRNASVSPSPPPPLSPPQTPVDVGRDAFLDALRTWAATNGNPSTRVVAERKVGGRDPTAATTTATEKL